jgi:hypothetical protein
MGYKFNPFTGSLDTTDSPNGVFEEIDVNGDITLDDGGTFTTTLQTVTPTANRTISFPDATGTVALVAGSSGQVVYNNAGAYAGVPSTVIGATGDVTLALNGAASTPPLELTGTWFTGGTATTTKPQVLIEPAGTTSTAWSTSGTGLGVNAASGFAGRLLDLQLNGTSRAVVTGAGQLLVGTTTAATKFGNASIAPAVQIAGSTASTSSLALHKFGADANPCRFTLLKNRAVDAAGDGGLQVNDPLGVISFEAADGFGGSFLIGAEIGAYAETGHGSAADDAPSRLTFSTTADGAASPTERLRITSAGVLQIADAGNITVGTTTGTKIGTATTQKLGFFNKTPVVQPIAVADATTAVDVITQFNALLARMRDLGLIAT